MEKSKYYTSGQFAKMAGVSIRTIRFYDNRNILKPTFVNESGARFYSDEDFAKLQQILLFKFLGFSLDDIKEMVMDTTDISFMNNALKLQKQLIEDKIEQMELVKLAIDDTIAVMNTQGQPDWKSMLDIIHLTGMENSLKAQYKNAGNISARIRLHKDYSVNRENWFSWVYDRCHIGEGMRVLELGAGNGAIWMENMHKLPKKISVVVSDISEGMVRDARRNIGKEDIFTYASFDCARIPYDENTFDVIIANHLLFYCDDIVAICKEIRRVLKPGGRFVCSTYGKDHMKEITQLVQGFDGRIVLAAQNLSDSFGLENGSGLLSKVFESVSCERYEDEIFINKAEPLVEYILSCHGNQNQYLPDKYKEFKSYVDKKVKYGFHITKDAGIFTCV